MIRSFARHRREAEALFRRFRVNRLKACESIARRKLAQLDAAATLDDPASLPETVWRR